MADAVILELESILDLLPHRYPFLLVDKVLQLIPGISILALKNVTINEPFFQGHFPKKPIMPGALMLEAMGQTVEIFSIYSDSIFSVSLKKSWYVLSKVDKAQFKCMVKPGDQLLMKALLQWKRGDFVRCFVTVHVDKKLIGSAEITLAKQNF